MTLAAGVGVSAARPLDSSTLSIVLQRAAGRVERYLARAQSIACLERVHLQPLSASWSSDGFGRTVESALHLSWQATDASDEAQAIREVLRVNGRKSGRDDRDNCTTPEQETREPQPLSLLLPAKRSDYEFTMAGHGRVDRRPAVVVDYRVLTKLTVDTRMVDGRDDCISFNIDGGMRGRIWIDAETGECAAARSELDWHGGDPLAKTCDPTRRYCQELDDGVVGHIDSIQGRNVYRSR